MLLNPGIGFMTFQRFNGDALNQGLKWTEGYPIAYQEYTGSLENRDHPATTMAYFRIYWRFVEPERGKYNWEMLDRALAMARSRKQTLLLRIAPYGTNKDNDVPDWYRAMVGDESGKGMIPKWRTDPEDPRYARHYGAMIRAVGARYDGHPDLESVDLAIVGAWGEGAGADRLSRPVREALVDAYLEGFRETPLIMLLTDAGTNGYGISKRNVGWRVDCLGDMGGFGNPNWSHMQDYYPQHIINFGMADAWKRAPVSFEACWVMQHWKDKGWDVDYIIDQSLAKCFSRMPTSASGCPATRSTTARFSCRETCRRANTRSRWRWWTRAHGSLESSWRSPARAKTAGIPWAR